MGGEDDDGADEDTTEASAVRAAPLLWGPLRSKPPLSCPTLSWPPLSSERAAAAVAAVGAAGAAGISQVSCGLLRTAAGCCGLALRASRAGRTRSWSRAPISRALRSMSLVNCEATPRRE